MAETDSFTEGTKDPSFPYLENASQGLRHLNCGAQVALRTDPELENSGMSLK